MKVRIGPTPLVHRCPYRDELDVGEVQIEYELAREEPGPEFHEVRAHLDTWATASITHEDITTAIANEFRPCTVTTRWVTAGMTITIREEAA